jgi:N-carbamoyl-L-amino-acid hydrolase
VWDWQEKLARHSDPGYAEKGQLTVTYLTDAHRAAPSRSPKTCATCGFDEVSIDAVGNVVGRYEGASAGDAKTLLTGSHYDTVRNGGKYDGRLGIFTPMACVRELARQGKRLPFGIEVVGFAEEEGQRYKATFLGSGALIGHFNPLAGAEGRRRHHHARGHAHAGLPPPWKRSRAEARSGALPRLRRSPHRTGPGAQRARPAAGHRHLHQRRRALPVRSDRHGQPRRHHADGPPPRCRRGGRRTGLFVEQRAARRRLGRHHRHPQVPSGSINVVPGRCKFTLDLRAPNDRAARRDGGRRAAEAQGDLRAPRPALQIEQTMRAAAAPSAPEWQQRWERAVDALGLPLYRMPSGAGHDAMKLHEVMPQAMLFVRGRTRASATTRWNPPPATTSSWACRPSWHLLEQLAKEHP